MTENPGRGADIYSRKQERRGGRMPEIVKARRGDLGPTRQAFERAGGAHKFMRRPRASAKIARSC
jgi:hypothetical protein